MKTKLQNICAYLADPKRWTQQTLARNSLGTPVPYDADNAECHCLMGAIARETSDIEERRAIELALEAALPNPVFKSCFSPMAAFNDDPATDHARVLTLLDAAIQEAP